MTNIAPIFTWASWWKSDDKFVWISNSFQDSSNIEIYENPRTISLTKKLTKDSWNVVTEKINCFLRVSNGNILAFWSSWWVYRKHLWVWVKNSNSISWAILSAIEYKNFVYLTNATNLYKVAVSSLSNTMTFTSVNTLNSSNYHPFVLYNDLLIIWNGRLVSYIDSVWDFVELWLNNDEKAKVKFLQTIWNNIKVYLEYSNKTEVKIWDWLGDAPLDWFTINWVIIDQLITKQGYDYILTNWQLWILDWYREIKLKEIKDYSKNLNSIEVLDNKLVFWQKWAIYTWGALNKNYPEALSLSNTTSNNINDDIGALLVDWNDLYVSWWNSWTFWIDKISNWYNTSWYLTTRVYYWNARVLNKSSVLIKTAFDKLVWNNQIKIYYRYNLTWDFILHTTLTASSVKSNDYYDDKSFIWSWNFIEIKFELIWDWNSTPELFECFIWFNKEKQWLL